MIAWFAQERISCPRLSLQENTLNRELKSENKNLVSLGQNEMKKLYNNGSCCRATNIETSKKSRNLIVPEGALLRNAIAMA